MSATTQSGMATKTALGLIAVYQRWISPRKGFRCAHSVLHGGPGCSGFAKETIRDVGLWRAIKMIRRRFKDCHTAMVTLAAQKGPTNEDQSQSPIGKKPKSSWCGPADCAPDCGTCFSSKASVAGGGAAMGAEATTGICGGAMEGVTGAVGGCLGGISCCGS